MKENRREFLKKISVAGAALTAAPFAQGQNLGKSQAQEHNDSAAQSQTAGQNTNVQGKSQLTLS